MPCQAQASKRVVEVATETNAGFACGALPCITQKQRTIHFFCLQSGPQPLLMEPHRTACPAHMALEALHACGACKHASHCMHGMAHAGRYRIRHAGYACGYLDALTLFIRRRCSITAQ